MKGLFYSDTEGNVRQIISEPFVADNVILVVSRCIKEGKINIETVIEDIGSVFNDEYLINKEDVIN